MKRFFLLILLSIFFLGIAKGQNANRDGFFVELGIGCFVGNTPRTSISVADNVMNFKCLNGSAANFGFGGRLRIKSHWAYEFKLDTHIPFKNTIDNFVFRLLPMGVRYTSSEIWRNNSLYFHINLGGALSANSGIINGGNLEGFIDYDNVLYPDMQEEKIKGFEEKGKGIAYSVGVGANITTHFYMEGCFNAQVLFDCYSKNGNGMINYGVPTFILGYRF